jgi:hypothetical protein
MALVRVMLGRRLGEQNEGLKPMANAFFETERPVGLLLIFTLVFCIKRLTPTAEESGPSLFASPAWLA